MNKEEEILAPYIVNHLQDDNGYTFDVVFKEDALKAMQEYAATIKGIGWVEASERLPKTEKDDIVVISNGEPCYADFRFHRVCMAGTPNGCMGKGFQDKENHLPIDVTQWLDENLPPNKQEQREAASMAFDAGFYNGMYESGLDSELKKETYLNTNYPLK